MGPQALQPSIGQIFLSNPVSFDFEPLYLLVLDTPPVVALSIQAILAHTVF